MLSCVQATQLLQARKSEEDVPGICEMCDKLRVSQVSADLDCDEMFISLTGLLFRLSKSSTSTLRRMSLRKG